MSAAIVEETDERLVVESLQRVAADLSMVTDRPLAIQSVGCERVLARPAGQGSVHVSFKVALRSGDTIAHGAVLVPYDPAVILASGMLMLDEKETSERRARSTPDPSIKDALLEIGNFVASALSAALRTLGRADVQVVSEGCQGVRANVRPAIDCPAGTKFTVGRARARLAAGEPFDIVMMLPPIA